MFALPSTLIASTTHERLAKHHFTRCSMFRGMHFSPTSDALPEPVK